jgi:hypothetical protein
MEGLKAHFNFRFYLGNPGKNMIFYSTIKIPIL